MNADALRALDAVRLAAASGSHRIAFDRLDSNTQQLLALARDVGAPLALAAGIAHGRMTHAGDVARAAAVASAEARSVAGFLLAAPLVLLPLTGQVLDVSVWTFYSQPLGLGVFVVAGMLYGLGFAVIRQLRRGLDAPVVDSDRTSGSPVRVVAGVLLVFGVSRGSVWLIGAALVTLVWVWALSAKTAIVTLSHLAQAAEVVVLTTTAGQSVPHALRRAAVMVPAIARVLRQIAFSLDCGVKPVTHGGVLDQFGAIAWQAHHDGAPAVTVFRQFAQQVRADEQAVLLARASRLSARLTIPTTLFFLPATVLIMVAPVVAHGVTVLSW